MATENKQAGVDGRFLFAVREGLLNQSQGHAEKALPELIKYDAVA